MSLELGQMGVLCLKVKLIVFYGPNSDYSGLLHHEAGRVG
jgi:hypothetical protein